MPKGTLALVNATGRQAASLARVASALGFTVRAHVHQASHPVARELSGLSSISVREGSLTDAGFVAQLFAGAQHAFVNTVSFGDELVIGKALADAAKKAGIQHYIYSSMPDHGIYGKGWPSLPLWSVKYAVENYIRQVGGLLLAMRMELDKGARSVYRPPLYIQASITIISPRSPIRFSA